MSLNTVKPTLNGTSIFQITVYKEQLHFAYNGIDGVNSGSIG
jgi:hypothetical protein